MACFRPLSAWQRDDGSITFVERGAIRRPLQLPCGQCVGCRLERSRKWAMRCLHEAQMHEDSSYVTLTYNDENCPVSLVYSDFQAFMRRLRKRHGKARFFMCGEYGEENWRPHFHAIIFGVGFRDRTLHSERGDVRVFRSAALEGLWPFGFSTVGDVTFQSAAYVARYVMKKVNGDRADEHYQRVSLSTGELVRVKSEFCRMSLKPGIGATWLQKYRPEVYGRTFEGVMVNGVRQKPPRYYDKKLEELDPELYEGLELLRYEKAGRCSDDSTVERLAVRERVAEARVSMLKRTL